MAKIKLGDVIIARRPIFIDDENYFEVRGISLADLFSLFQEFHEEISEIFDRYMERLTPGRAITMEEVQEFMMSALQKSPTLVYKLIATAADDVSPESMETIKHLRLGVQIDALTAIMELSITTEAELKKAVEAATNLIVKVTGLVLNMKGKTGPSGFVFPNGSSQSASA